MKAIKVKCPETAAEAALLTFRGQYQAADLDDFRQEAVLAAVLAERKFDEKGYEEKGSGKAGYLFLAAKRAIFSSLKRTPAAAHASVDLLHEEDGFEIEDERARMAFVAVEATSRDDEVRRALRALHKVGSPRQIQLAEAVLKDTNGAAGARTTKELARATGLAANYVDWTLGEVSEFFCALARRRELGVVGAQA